MPGCAQPVTKSTHLYKRFLKNMENQAKDKVIPAPDYTLPPLQYLEKTGTVRGHNGVTFVTGEGIKPADIMFITSCISPQEASKFLKGRDGDQGVRVQPRYLRSDAGIMFSDIFNQEGIDLYKCYYTALVKWLLPKNERIKIPKDVVAWALPALEEEINIVSPKIIVCIGKHIFDLLANVKLSLSDAKSGWFYNEKYNAKIYLIDDTYKLVSNPEYIGKFHVEAREINRMYKEICNISTGRIPLNYETITNSSDLKRVVSNWKLNNFNVISVDCEWAGNNHIDGKLRSTQFCWAPGHACYVRWMDDKGNYTFDIPYKEAGAILAEWLDLEDVKYIGHHFAADAPWLHHVLGLNWYEKCIFDTEFAQQTANEAEDLSLERIAMKYTDLGRYDLDLVLWVKHNKALMVDGGYGAIPDEIIIPYAIKDVDTVFRAWPFIHRSLQAQDLLDYYNNIFHPFVTDVFVSFALVGLPMDVDMMDELRVLYTFARDKMEVILREEIHVEAKNFVLKAFATRLSPELAAEKYLEFISLIVNSEHTEAWAVLKCAAKKPDDVPKLKYIFDHFIDSANFNIRSSTQLKRWLFNVKCYEPVKSTGNKEKGLPATSWEKIKSMPPEAQKNYNPAVDKQTLQILSEQNNDALLRRLLQLNAVGNICKAFLKEADIDADGNVVKENGLHFFLCSDKRVHGQMSTTETGRPRCVHGDTLIRCFDGFKCIKDIKIGDLVWTHLNRWRKVEDKYIKPVAPMYEVSFDNGEVLLCTEEHLLLTEDGKWISVRDVCLQKAFKQSGTEEESCFSLPRVLEYRRASSGESEYNSPHYLSNTSCRARRGRIQKAQSDKILELKAGREEPMEREEGGRGRDLEGGLRRWLRLFNTPNRWPTLLRTSYSHGRGAGDAPLAVAESPSCASYRSGSEKQYAGQLSTLHHIRAQRYPRKIQTYRSGIKIKRVVPCGSYPVYDISVEEDHSYEASGCFSHNSWKPNSLNWPSYVNSMISNGIAGLFGKLKERGELPEEFEKFIIKDEEGEYKSVVPSIRSCVKAPEGWCFVESDYQTAEIRGLAFVSGDKNLIDIVCNPDLNFAVTKDDKKVRLAFPPEVFPPSTQEEYKHLLISPDDPSLVRKDDGSLKHPKQDLHWSLAEMVHIKPREVLDEKKDRGAAKVGNFCVAENELVLTHNGLKPIQYVSDCDLLWDGVEWVSHEGVVYSGEKEVIEYQGLRATKLHDVWAEQYGKVKFGEAKRKQFELIRSEETCCSFEYTRLADISRYSREERRRIFLRMDALQVMRRGKAKRPKKYGKGVFRQVPVSKPSAYNFYNTGRIKKSTSNARIALSGYGAALSQRHTCVLREVQAARYKSRVFFTQRILSVGSANLAGRVFRKERFRPYRQCGQLFQNKFEGGRPRDEFVEQRLHARNSYRACSKIYGAASRYILYRKNCFRLNSLRVTYGGNTAQTCVQPESRLAKVYDIVNAGPRNRFTCQGVLVSNSSAYGASASTLERKIEQDTGKKPEEGTGQRLLKALEKRQPVAQDFLIKMERVPEKPGYYRAASGRIRHFSSHDPKYLDDIDEHLTMGLFKSMGREARNFPMQESVAATAARAGKWLLDAYIKLNMQARPLIILYDSVVTLCPLEERFKVAQLHQLFMTDANTWDYHGRKMNYPIDTDYVYRWSAKPDKNDKKLLEDKTYKTN
jgi:uracil-DNA glycosylase family 4